MNTAERKLVTAEVKIQQTQEKRGVFSLLMKLKPQQREQLSRLLNSGSLILGRIASSGLGYITWLITARMYDAGEVGIASGVVSAMMLCVQIALFGIGAAVIKIYPQHLESPSKLINSALNFVGISSLISAGLFLIFARVFFNELNVVAAIPTYAMLFLGINLFGSINVLMDHVSIAIKRSDQVLTRNVLFGLTTIAGVAGLSLLSDSPNSIAIIAAWAAAGLLACILGSFQLYRSIPMFKYTPSIVANTGRQLIGIGLPNYLLTLAERAPNWILPIIITELLSPVENARWYAVWMMAWVVFLVPISIGQTLFAEISENPDDFKRSFHQSLRNSLIVGGIAAVVVMIGAKLLLMLLGAEYAAAGVAPLKILALAIIPITITQMYYAVCRGTLRLREATLTSLIAGTTGVGLATLAGTQYGLNGMAIAWLITQSIAAIWSGYRTSIIMRLSGQQISIREILSVNEPTKVI